MQNYMTQLNLPPIHVKVKPSKKTVQGRKKERSTEPASMKINHNTIDYKWGSIAGFH